MTATASPVPFLRNRGPEPRCEAVTGHRRSDFAGFEPVTCRQSRGLRSYLAADGSRHRYCAAPGHEADVRARVRRNVG